MSSFDLLYKYIRKERFAEARDYITAMGGVENESICYRSSYKGAA